MREPLPLLLSIPHCGREIPECVQDRIALSQADILEDADAFTHKIYNFAGRVRTVLQADVARVIVDLNRDAKQLPPTHPDGVVKSVTCYNKPVYRQGQFPDCDLIKKLIQNHYEPYHNTIRQSLQNNNIAIAFDCHSMAQQAPPVAPNHGQRRPTINIGNVRGRSCPMDLAKELAACFRDVWGLQDNDVTLNKPFSGGFITRTYGTGKIPWMQIEISRAVYMERPWFDPATLTVSQRRLGELNDLLWQVFQRFCTTIAGL